MDDNLEDDVEELVDETGARLIVGGGRKPVSRATFWRGIHDGIYSGPVKIGVKMNRWRPKKLRRDLVKIIETLNSEVA